MKILIIILLFLSVLYDLDVLILEDGRPSCSMFDLNLDTISFMLFTPALEKEYDIFLLFEVTKSSLMLVWYSKY